MNFKSIRGVWARRSVAKKTDKFNPTDIKSIAILRHAALGDMVLTRSFIIEARKFFPNAKITLSVISNYTRGTPEDLVDRVHVIHGTDQRGTSIRTRVKRIRELGYHDLIFDLAGGNRSFFTCFLNSAMLKIGFPYRKIRAWMFYDITTPRNDLNFEVNDMLNMLQIFGAKTSYPHIYNMPGEPVQRDREFIIYFAGASDQNKCWPADNFSALIGQMSVLYPDVDHLILDGLKTWERADNILGPMKKSDNIGSVQADTIEETISLMKSARLLVSNDTGIRHIAITCNTPTIGIFLNQPYRYWPRYNNHEAVFPDIDGNVSSVSELKDSCVELLERTSNQR